MVPKDLGAAILYENDKLFALVNPKQHAVYVGSERLCLFDFFKRRNMGIILSDADVARAHRALEASGWQIVPVRMGIFTKEVGKLSRLIGV
jgi:hypothetical protein